MTLEVQPRETRGKNEARRLRAAGEVPAVVYGGGRDTVAIRVQRRVVEQLLKTAGEHGIFLLQLAGTGKSRHTMIRDMQVDPVTGEMIHIDFLRVLMDQVVRVTVPVELQGNPIGVRQEDGILEFVTRELEIECLPGQIPAHLDVDVTELHVGQHIEAGELELPEGVTLLEDQDRVITSVSMKRLEEELVEEEEELITAEAAEPEVIGREEEEGAAEEGTE
jgi:large subunit ribosomal protein L25